MHLRYTKSDGTKAEIPLSEKPITIGRSPKADVVLEDEKASRLHCGIRNIDNEYRIKDLGSKNGTYLNDERIESATLTTGDKLCVGRTILHVEEAKKQGATTALEDIQQEISGGKGYDTILKEIVSSAEPKTRK